MFTLKKLHRSSFQILKTFRKDYSIDNTIPPENPIKRTLRIISNDVKYVLGGSNFKHYNSNRTTYKGPITHCDVAIFGGGVIGSAIAYSLKVRASRGLNIVVVEKDPTYSKASTVLSVGGLRQQFSLSENIMMSQYAATFFRDIKEHLGDVDLHFTPYGYLLLANEKTASQLEANYKLQQEMSVKNTLLSKTQLKNKFPWLNTDDIVLGCLGLQDEGWFDPWALLHGFKKKAIELGVHYIKGEVIDFNHTVKPGVTIIGVPMGTYEQIASAKIKTDYETYDLKFAIGVIAAGAFSGEIARMAKIGCGNHPLLQIPLPVEPRKRFVYCFSTQNENMPGINTPMVFDPSGTYFRREGLSNNFIGGRAPAANCEPSVENLDVDYDFFDTEVWPCLAHRVPSFEGLKVNSAWAGYYEFNTYDENGIIGQHPYHINLFIATGFSGHGIQQAPAVGRAMAELILDCNYKTIDLTKLSFERLLHDMPMIETNIF